MGFQKPFTKNAVDIRTGPAVIQKAMGRVADPRKEKALKKLRTRILL